MPINTHLIFSLKAQSSNQFLEWINYQYPLTDKLREVNGDAQLELLSQQWLPTDMWSKSLLVIEDKTVFQREILMRSKGVIYWYARSIIPKACYELAPSFFDRLKNESIRNLIFNNDQVRRINAINYPVDQQCVEFFWVKKYIELTQETLWVRLAEFSFQQQESFYLIEIMLPALGEIKP